MGKRTARQIVQEKMPGKHVVAPPAAGDAAPQADAVSVDLAALRRKYFGDVAASSPEDVLAAAPRAASPDTGIVLVSPAHPAIDAGRSQTKAVVVTDGEISGEQG